MKSPDRRDRTRDEFPVRCDGGAAAPMRLRRLQQSKLVAGLHIEDAQREIEAVRDHSSRVPCELNRPHSRRKQSFRFAETLTGCDLPRLKHRVRDRSDGRSIGRKCEDVHFLLWVYRDVLDPFAGLHVMNFESFGGHRDA